MMKQILFATSNPSKVKRFAQSLKEKGIELLTLKDLKSKIEVEENGKNAIENALIKARAYSKLVDIPVLAMDDNLYLEKVPDDKQPGMYVRRVNDKRLTDEEMIEHYTKLVRDYGVDGKLPCRWIYGIALIKNGEEKTYTWSKDDLYMVDKISTKINPGYPLSAISINKNLNKYCTEITDEEKANLPENDFDVIDFICKNI